MSVCQAVTGLPVWSSLEIVRHQHIGGKPESKEPGYIDVRRASEIFSKPKETAKIRTLLKALFLSNGNG